MDGETITRLAPYQRRILTHLARGETAKETGASLGYRPHTVEVYAAQIRARLGALNTAHAVAIALTAGLISYRDQEVPDGR